MQVPTTIVWFRQDLRLSDHPALRAAADTGAPVVPVYIWSPEEEGEWTFGSASRWWLHQSLRSLDAGLRKLESRLILRSGPTLDNLVKIARGTGATRIVWNRRYEPEIIRRDSEIKSRLRNEGIEADSFNASLLFEPWEIQTTVGRPYQVYSPFWRACLAYTQPPRPEAIPTSLQAPEKWPESASLESLGLEPKIDWAAGMRSAWSPGEDGARKQLEVFLNTGVSTYAEQRDRPDVSGTSALSPHLHFGEISPRTIWYAVLERFGCPLRASGLPRNPEVYLKEVVWREFAYHLLYHFPHTTNEPLRSEFRGFPWRRDTQALRSWQRGRTGYPFVDAGMRQLWATGWMHNRVRMVVASFLVKHLLLPWQEGARWFWDTLVDADLASNTLGWQWTAGCGADAAPYFRIFNPITQGEKFDPSGVYVRRWVPELAQLPDQYIHRPWEADRGSLIRAGVELGTNYPRPIVDHGFARERALEALASISKKSS